MKNDAVLIVALGSCRLEMLRLSFIVGIISGLFVSNYVPDGSQGDLKVYTTFDASDKYRKTVVGPT
jgi:hypothetical protein